VFGIAEAHMQGLHTITDLDLETSLDFDQEDVMTEED
jgi:hypothetical protein